MDAKAKCNIAGCDRDAQWQVGFRAWAVGYAKTSTPLSGLFGLAVCDDHRDDVDIKSLFPPASIERLNASLVMRGRAPADWANAELVLEPVLDGKLQQLL